MKEVGVLVQRGGFVGWTSQFRLYSQFNRKPNQLTPLHCWEWPPCSSHLWLPFHLLHPFFLPILSRRSGLGACAFPFPFPPKTFINYRLHRVLLRSLLPSTTSSCSPIPPRPIFCPPLFKMIFSLFLLYLWWLSGPVLWIFDRFFLLLNEYIRKEVGVLVLGEAK